MKPTKETCNWIFLKAAELFIKYGLVEQGWNFKINYRKKRSLGTCYVSKKIITLSNWFIFHKESTESDIIDTLLHEIAHAICPNDGHGKEWRKIALSMGCTGEVRGNFEIEGVSKYIAICSKCGEKHGLNRLGKALKMDLTTDKTVYRCLCGNPIKFQINENIS
jgi:predicted SprT family Zn-dependent metalloprotease